MPPSTATGGHASRRGLPSEDLDHARARRWRIGVAAVAAAVLVAGVGVLVGTFGDGSVRVVSGRSGGYEIR